MRKFTAIKKIWRHIKKRQKETAKTAGKQMAALWRRQKIGKSEAVKVIMVLLFCAALAGEYFETRQTARFEEEILPLKEKIGQMLMIGFRGTEAPADSYIAGAIAELNLGGVILFDYDAPSKSRPRNIVDWQQTQNLIANLKSYD